MALLAVFRPDYKPPEELIFDLKSALDGFDPTAEVDDEPKVEEIDDPTFDGALMLWAFFRDVHLIRGSIVEMEKPHLDIDPTYTTKTKLPKGVSGKGR